MNNADASYKERAGELGLADKQLNKQNEQRRHEKQMADNGRYSKHSLRNPQSLTTVQHRTRSSSQVRTAGMNHTLPGTGIQRHSTLQLMKHQLICCIRFNHTPSIFTASPLRASTPHKTPNTRYVIISQPLAPPPDSPAPQVPRPSQSSDPSASSC